jgi:glycosyltransferase involved in cell wall biosynthesis
MRPTRILYVNHVARISGGERGLVNTVRRLDKTEFEVVVALPATGSLSEELTAAGAKVVCVDICRLTKTWNPILLLKYYFSWLRGVRQLTRLIQDMSIDMVYANSNTAQICAGPAAGRAGIPCIWHSRDLVSLGPLFRWVSKRATLVVAISKAVEKHLRDNGVDPLKTRMIHNAVDTDVFKSQSRRDEMLERMGVTAENQLVATVGQLVPWKKHDMFLRCAALILQKRPNTMFAIIGDDMFKDNGSYAAGLKKAAERSLPGRIIFPGYCVDMPAMLEGVDVLLHPASREPFGRVIIEAMAMGKPVVAVDSCGPAEIINSEEDGILVPEGDVEAMAAAAVKLLSDDAFARKIGEAARKKVETQFSVKDTPSAIADLCSDAIGVRSVENDTITRAWEARRENCPEGKAEGRASRETCESFLVALNGMLLGGEFSGVEEAILGLARTLAEGGRHKYRFFVPDSCSHSDLVGPGFETERVKIPRSRLIRLLWEQKRLPAILKKGGFDLLHAPAYLAPLSADIPVVLTVYDLQTLLFPGLCLPLNRLNYRMMLPRSIRKASGIIVPSKSVADDVIRLFPDASERIEVIPIGVNPSFRVLGSSDQAMVLAGLGLKEPFVLFAGNMAPNKNLITLVRAFGMMKRDHAIPHKLVLAGRKAWEYQKICRCIKEEGLAEEVNCIGYVSERELVGLYNAADVFVFPSLYEGFGLPPLEAMACGTPVVCSSQGGLKETAGPAAQLVDHSDANAISDAVADLIEDRAKHDALRKKGLEHAKAFTWENARLQTEAFYEKILSSP